MPIPKAQKAALLATPEETEAQFYEAMQRGDLDAMMAIWSDDDEVVCVHPGGPRVIGPSAIRATFDAIFSNGAVPVQPHKRHAVVTAHCAMHNVVERVDMVTDEGVQTAFVLATNVYIRTEHGWRMVAHHASPGSPRELPEITEAPSVLH